MNGGAPTERGRGMQWQEISEEELAEHGWKYNRQTDNSVFTVLTEQGINFDKALLQGRIYARHQPGNEGKTPSQSHVDNLKKETWGGVDIVATVPNPLVDRHTFVVLDTLD